jgi:hypothetical protein
MMTCTRSAFKRTNQATHATLVSSLPAASFSTVTMLQLQRNSRHHHQSHALLVGKAAAAHAQLASQQPPAAIPTANLPLQPHQHASHSSSHRSSSSRRQGWKQKTLRRLSLS